MDLQVDEKAKEIALRMWKVPPCLHVPVAAVDEDAIRTYIGEIETERQNRAGLKTFLVRIPAPPPRDDRLRIWDLPGSAEFFSPCQVWVDIHFKRYRPAFAKLLPDRNISGMVLSHAMNRKTAFLKGYQYVRLTPVLGRNNTSSGFSEQWAVARYTADLERNQEQKRQGAFI